ncbi:hypothetical protein, partial [uncultured Bacteroides sp.]
SSDWADKIFSNLIQPTGRTIGIFTRYTENYAYLRSRKQGFFEMAEAKSGWIPLRFHHRIDTKKGNG